MSLLHPLAAVAAAAVMAAAPQMAQANLVTNGDFETGTIAGWSYSGTVDFNLFVQGQFAHAGSYGTGIGPNGFVATLSQSVATVIGQSYDLDFWLALSPPNGTGHMPNLLEVSVDGNALLSLADVAPFGFTHYAYSFTATQANTTLSFDVRNDPWGFSLDDVAINRSMVNVPEPGSLALVALALAGLRWRRRG